VVVVIRSYARWILNPSPSVEVTTVWPTTREFLTKWGVKSFRSLFFRPFWAGPFCPDTRVMTSRFSSRIVRDVNLGRRRRRSDVGKATKRQVACHGSGQGGALVWLRRAQLSNPRRCWVTLLFPYYAAIAKCIISKQEKNVNFRWKNQPVYLKPNSLKIRLIRLRHMLVWMK